MVSVTWVIEIRILPGIDDMYLSINPKLILFLTTKRKDIVL